MQSLEEILATNAIELVETAREIKKISTSIDKLPVGDAERNRLIAKETQLQTQKTLLLERDKELRAEKTRLFHDKKRSTEQSNASSAGLFTFVFFFCLTLCAFLVASRLQVEGNFVVCLFPVSCPVSFCFHIADFTAPFRLASHSSESGRLDSIRKMHRIVYDRWEELILSLQQNRYVGKLRVEMPATISGPGGGKSYFIDEWMSVLPKDMDALEAEIAATRVPYERPSFDLFRQAIRTSIRLPMIVRLWLTLKHLASIRFETKLQLHSEHSLRALFSFEHVLSQCFFFVGVGTYYLEICFVEAVGQILFFL